VAGRLSLLGVSALFAATALLLPERLTNFSNHHALEIGQIVEQLQAEVQTHCQVKKSWKKKRPTKLEQQLAAMKKDSSGLDPE